MSDTRIFVIVGGGQAGRWLALTLRGEGFTGRIVWFSEESEPPYERPPLSKAVIKGDTTLAHLALIPPERFAELQLDWRPGESVVSIDRATRQIRTAHGATQTYDTLFLAHGGHARMLPGLMPHPHVLSLRTWTDALTLKARLVAARHVLVLGGGWIGLEVAASARRMGCEVTVLEGAARLCARTVPPCVSEHLRCLHEREGTSVVLGAAVTSVQPDELGVQVTLADGRQWRGDLLVVGIGLVANDELAAQAGLACENGVLTNALGGTGDTAIYAVGDVANTLRANGQRLRIESWENAQRQAVAAARTALGVPHDPEADGPSWFWSDQYDDNLQVLGLPTESMRLIERRDDTRHQRLFFFCDGPRVRALAAVNAGREVKVVRKWMQQQRFPALELLIDTTRDLNKLPLNPVEQGD